MVRGTAVITRNFQNESLFSMYMEGNQLETQNRMRPSGNGPRSRSRSHSSRHEESAARSVEARSTCSTKWHILYTFHRIIRFKEITSDHFIKKQHTKDNKTSDVAYAKWM